MKSGFLDGVGVIADDSVRSEVEQRLEELFGKPAWFGIELTAAMWEKDDEIGFGFGLGYVLLDLIKLRSLNGVKRLIIIGGMLLDAESGFKL